MRQLETNLIVSGCFTVLFYSYTNFFRQVCYIDVSVVTEPCCFKMSAAGGQTRSAPSRPSPAPRQSYSQPSAPIYSAPSIHTFRNEYITTIPLTAPAPSHYMGPATSFGLGSSSLFFIAFCMGCASMIAVSGFLSEKTFGGSFRAGSQTSSVLKLQVPLLYQFFVSE